MNSVAHKHFEAAAMNLDALLWGALISHRNKAGDDDPYPDFMEEQYQALLQACENTYPY